LPASYLIDEQLLSDIGLQMCAAVEHVFAFELDIMGKLVKQQLDDVFVVVED
jgi:hypothetical protein